MSAAEWIAFIFVTFAGACVGSFLNVVVYRLPRGESIVTPPSACPKCGHRLAAYDNIPVLGWLMLRGRCRYCGEPISPQYPLVEGFVAIVFGAWFYICYGTALQPAFAGPGLAETALIFLVTLTLLGGLVAATLIDARLYIIPLQIPWLIAGVAVVLLPLAVWLFPLAVVTVELPPAERVGLAVPPSERLAEVPAPYETSAAVLTAVEFREPGPVTVTAAPIVTARTAWAATLAMIGLIVANLLVWRGVLPQSFADEERYLPPPEQDDREQGHEGGRDAADAAPVPSGSDKNVETVEAAGAHGSDPHAYLAYPHARREMLKEMVFLSLPIAGFVIGWMIIGGGEAGADGGGEAGGEGVVWRVFGGVLCGYLAGGFTVWATRVLGTLGFGKEAMGLGDVHLMAAVGAVAGWQVAVVAFFVAPFFGLVWALLAAGAEKLLRRQVRAIPYGPHLAAATVLVLVFREPILAHLGILIL